MKLLSKGQLWDADAIVLRTTVLHRFYCTKWPSCANVPLSTHSFIPIAKPGKDTKYQIVTALQN